MFADVAVDCHLEVHDGAKHITPEPSAGERSKEGLDRIQPGACGRGDVEYEVGMTGEPRQQPRVLVSGTVVQDHMHDRPGWDRRVDRVGETVEFLVAMPLRVAAQHHPLQHVESGKQRRRARRL